LERTIEVLRRVFIVSIIICTLLPGIPLVLWSISHRWWFPNVLPEELSPRAFAYVLESGSQVLRAVGNSLAIAASVTVLSIVLGTPAGRALGRYKFAGKRVVEFLVVAPVLTPPIAVVMGVHVLFIRVGLVDTMLGVILVHLLPALPYMILVMAGVFANYNPNFELQAHSLGAGPVATFLRITLPAIVPGLVSGGLFSFLISWSQYLLTLVIGGGRVLTLPVLLFSFATSGDNALTALLSLIFLFPALVVLVFTSRFLSGRSTALSGIGRV
jgi:putative spermidine/putrescine transport system permease protein